VKRRDEMVTKFEGPESTKAALEDERAEMERQLSKLVSVKTGKEEGCAAPGTHRPRPEDEALQPHVLTSVEKSELRTHKSHIAALDIFNKSQLQLMIMKLMEAPNDKSHASTNS